MASVASVTACVSRASRFPTSPNLTVAKPEKRLRYYSEAEKFLAKHPGGRFEE